MLGFVHARVIPVGLVYELLLTSADLLLSFQSFTFSFQVFKARLVEIRFIDSVIHLPVLCTVLSLAFFCVTGWFSFTRCLKY